MAHIYKPVMLLTVIRGGGTATKRQIAEQFLLADTNQVEYYQRKIVHPMPGKRLVRDGLLEKDGDTYRLAGLLANLSPDQMATVETVLRDRIVAYMEGRNPFGDSNHDAVEGSTRYEILRRAGGRCELCGVSSREMQIDVDHITPRAKGGCKRSVASVTRRSETGTIPISIPCMSRMTNVKLTVCSAESMVIE